MLDENHKSLGETRATIFGSCLLIVLLLVMAPPVLAAEDDGVEQGKILATARAKGNCLARHRFDDGELPGNLGPHILGGTAMGFGGVLALGCTIGQGVTGMSTLALGSLLSLISIIFGSALAMKVQ